MDSKTCMLALWDCLKNVKNITKLNEIELASGLIHTKSWHDDYKDSAWIFVGGLEYGLTEGDVLAVFSQYGEIVNINLVRDKKTGKSKGFCFLCYANQKSTVLAVDNFNGIKLCNRTIRVDHVANYKPPKESERDDDITKMLKSQGCAPEVPAETNNSADASDVKIKKRKYKKEKKEKKKRKKKDKSDTSDSEKETIVPNVNIKKEKQDPGYDKYDVSSDGIQDSRSESSHSHKNYRSKMDHCDTEKSKFIDKHSLKMKAESESSRYKDSDKDRDIPSNSSKKHKRKRSPSSAHTSSNFRENRYNDDREQSKGDSSIKRKYKGSKHNSSSSSDDDSSSTQSSSEDDEQNKYSKKGRSKTHDEKKSLWEESRDIHHRRSEKSDSTLNKSRHHDKSEKYSEYRSKTKHKSDDNEDTYSKHSRHYKS